MNLSVPPPVTAKCWAIFDGTSGEMLYSKEPFRMAQKASLTKVMTAHLVLRLCATDPTIASETVRVSKLAASMIGTSACLKEGDLLTVNELLYGLMLPSGNDAAMALAQHLGPRVYDLGLALGEIQPPPTYASVRTLCFALVDRTGREDGVTLTALHLLLRGELCSGTGRRFSPARRSGLADSLRSPGSLLRRSLSDALADRTEPVQRGSDTDSDSSELDADGVDDKENPPRPRHAHSPTPSPSLASPSWRARASHSVRRSPLCLRASYRPAASPGRYLDPVELFIRGMNARARVLGMSRTHYPTPHGLAHKQFASCAHDAGLLAVHVMADPAMRAIVSTRHYTVVVRNAAGAPPRALSWENTNRLLALPGFDGLKTGVTKAAGYCLASSARREGRHLICIVLGCDTLDDRFADTLKLFSFAWRLVLPMRRHELSKRDESSHVAAHRQRGGVGASSQRGASDRAAVAAAAAAPSTAYGSKAPPRAAGTAAVKAQALAPLPPPLPYAQSSLTPATAAAETCEEERHPRTRASALAEERPTCTQPADSHRSIASAAAGEGRLRPTPPKRRHKTFSVPVIQFSPYRRPAAPQRRAPSALHHRPLGRPEAVVPTVPPPAPVLFGAAPLSVRSVLQADGRTMTDRARAETVSDRVRRALLMNG